MKNLLKILACAFLLSPVITSGQVSAIYMPMSSAGGHTTWASGGYQSWTSTTTTGLASSSNLTYTTTIGYTGNNPVVFKGTYDTISNKDTGRGLNNSASAKVLTNNFTSSLPNCVKDTVRITSSYKSGSIQLTITKVSGTVTDTAWILVSDNGVNWYVSGQDTAIFTNISGTQTYIWELPGRLRKDNSALNATPVAVNVPYQGFYQKADDIPYQFYCVYVRGMNGTQSAIVKATILLRQGP